MTPDGLRRLGGMPTLTHLGVDAATFTATDVERLAKEMPGVTIRRFERAPTRPGGWRSVEKEFCARRCRVRRFV